MAVALALACQPASDEPVVRTIAGTPATVSVAPAASITPPAPAPLDVPVELAAVTATPAVLEVRVLAYLDGDRVPALHRLADRRLFVSDGPRIAEVPQRVATAPVNVRSGNDGLAWLKLPRVTPRSYDNMFSGEHLETFGGRWPEVLATVAFMAPRTGTARGVFRRAGSGWRRIPDDANGYLAAVAPWTDGRALGLRIEDMYSGTAEGFMPALEVFGANTPAPVLPADFHPYDLATTPEGDVFVLGARGDARTLWVLRWGPAGGEALAVDRLPEFRDPPAHEAQWFITAASATSAHVGGGYAVDPAQDTWTPYLAAFAGGTWTELRTPLVGRVGSMAHARDGSLWVSTSGEFANNEFIPGRGDLVQQGDLWRHATDGGWSSITLDTRDHYLTSEHPLDLGRFRVRSVALRGDRLCVLAGPQRRPEAGGDHHGSVLACAVDDPTGAPT